MFTKPYTLAWAFLLLVGHVQPLFAQVSGGNPLLTVTTAVIGSEPVAVTNTSTTLAYSKQGVITKITVATVCAGQRFTLQVLATGVTKGTAASQVTLTNGMLATDFIRDIPKTGSPSGTAILQYTASATFAQGNSVELGNDVHSVSYTLVAQ